MKKLIIDMDKCKHILIDIGKKPNLTELHRVTGVTLPTIDKYAAGAVFTSAKADKIAAALGVSVFDILSEVDVQE